MNITPLDSQSSIPEHERQNVIWLLFSFSLGHSAVAIIAINNHSRLAADFSLIAAYLYAALALVANRISLLPRLYQLVLSLMTLLILAALLIFARATQHIPTSLFISCGMLAGLALTWLDVRQAIGWSLGVLIPVLGAGLWFPLADPATIALTGMMLMLIAYMRQYSRGFLQIQARQDQLKHLAERDPLTGLYNRHALLEQAQHRLSTNTVLVLFDIDHFKQINDTHGHLYGDEILMYVAHCLREVLPPETLLARWGGEEFLAVFSDMAAYARDDVARALQRIEQTQFKNGVQITVSAGGALQSEAADLIRTDLAGRPTVIRCQSRRAKLCPVGRGLGRPASPTSRGYHPREIATTRATPTVGVLRETSLRPGHSSSENTSSGRMVTDTKAAL